YFCPTLQDELAKVCYGIPDPPPTPPSGDVCCCDTEYVGITACTLAELPQDKSGITIAPLCNTPELLSPTYPGQRVDFCQQNACVVIDAAGFAKAKEIYDSLQGFFNKQACYNYPNGPGMSGQSQAQCDQWADGKSSNQDAYRDACYRYVTSLCGGTPAPSTCTQAAQ